MSIFPVKKTETLIRNLNVVELKRLQLARALACRPKLLLLDELTTGLNPKEARKPSISSGISGNGDVYPHPSSM